MTFEAVTTELAARTDTKNLLKRFILMMWEERETMKEEEGSFQNFMTGSLWGF